MAQENIITNDDYLALPDEQLLRQCQAEFYKASGPGGQHRNKVSSAARLRHQPTGLVGICNDSRSQHDNKRVALQRLRAKIACCYRRPLDLAKLQLPPAVAGCLFRPRGGPKEGKLVLQVGRKDERYWPVVQFLLDLLEAHQGRLAEAAGQLGISTSNMVGVLRDEHEAFAAAAELRKRHGQGPLK